MTGPISTHFVAERLLLIRLTWAVVYHGADHKDPDIVAVLGKLKEAEEGELGMLPRERRGTAERHANRAAEHVLKPYIEQGTSCAKFGLSLYYAIQDLMSDGLYDVDANPDFEQALSAIINPNGTITEIHNIDGIDRSAQKQARHILTAIRSRGYFEPARMAA